MRGRVLRFVEELRAHDLPVSVAESMDAIAAVAAAGVERDVLRDALAATLVKDEHDRPIFDELFEQAFPLVAAPRSTRRGKRPRAAGAGEPTAGGGGGEGSGGRAGRRRRDVPQAPEAARAGHAAERGTEPPDDLVPSPERARSDRVAAERHDARPDVARIPGPRSARRRTWLRRPLHLLEPREVEEAREVVRELGARLRGRLARRERRRRHGRLDIRRMLRAATASGGVPLRLVHKGRRPDRPDLVALVDLSGSVATASELCLGLVAPAAQFFRRVHLFAYVDHPVPISIEHGHVAPEGLLDLHARSDFGRVLGEVLDTYAPLLGRTTLLLVVGDARNNRRPPRADLLRAIRERVQRLVWLVPEPRARWNTGDSALARYAPSCDAVFECETLGALTSALRATL
jgi:uncharacterized protein with von Willebrand factor type A (vWA) domain